MAPYNGSGTFSIINTFTPNTTILSSPVNANFSDVASNGLSNCLTRDGQAGMTAVLKLITGSVTAPSLSFTSDTNTGLYDAGADNPAMAAGGVQQQNWTLTSSVLATAITESGQISPTSLSADQNNYAPTSIETSSCLLMASSANVNITGMAGAAAGTAPVSGRKIKIVNTNASGGKNIIFNNANTSSTAANRFSMGGDLTLLPLQGCEFEYDGTALRWRLIGSFSFQSQGFVVPQFRLTLTTAVPVLTTDTTAITTVFYTPYLGQQITLWDGSVWNLSNQSEVSQTLADSTKSPTATSANNNYDYFAWSDSGTFRCTRGPAWTSSTGRGSGAGTTELVRVNGVWMNNVAITNGPAASRGIYVGSITTNASNQVDMMFAPAAAAGGSANHLYLWNYYNRIDISSMCRDSTNSWTYTTKTWQSADASTSNRISYTLGLNEDSITAAYNAFASNGSNNVAIYAGIGLDVTNAMSGISVPGYTAAASAFVGPVGLFRGFSGGIGLRFVQALEASAATNTTTWYGDNNEPTFTQSGLTVTLRM